MFALQDQDIPRAGARDLTRNGALARRLRRTAAGAVCAAAVALPLAGAATAQAATSAPHTLTTTWTNLTLLNGWTNYGSGTAGPAVTNTNGIVHLKGTIMTGGTNTVPFILPAGDRPANEVVVPVDLNAAVNGQLDIKPSGVVTVFSQQGWTYAQQTTSLEGASFAVSGSSFTPLALQGGWTNKGSGFASPAARNINGIVHLRGAIKTVSGSDEPFILPAGLRPNHEVYIPVALCNVDYGRLQILPDGEVFVDAGNMGNAQCGTSLDGAWFAASATNFTQLTLQNGWQNYQNGTTTAAVRKISGIVYLEGAISSGTNPQPFILPVGYRPSHWIYTSVDTSGASRGHVLIAPDGTVNVFGVGGQGNATSFTSLDGVSFAP